MDEGGIFKQLSDSWEEIEYLKKENKKLRDMCRIKSANEERTNEEWFCSLDTEDKAREISDMTAQGYWSEELAYKWLKEKYNA